MNVITKYPSKYFKINNNTVNVLSGLSFTGEKFNKHNIKINNNNKNKYIAYIYDSRICAGRYSQGNITNK